MGTLHRPRLSNRYHIVPEEKAGGATYTPEILADFVARQIVKAAGTLPTNRPLRVLDPAVGHGQLLVSLLAHLADQPHLKIEIHGFETNAKALLTATETLQRNFPNVPLHIEQNNFLEFVLEHFGTVSRDSLFRCAASEAYDLVIANPPYVRTQILGASQSRLLAEQFDLAGRVDLYFAFILGMSQVLCPHGVAGFIVSNRFMTTRSGASIRRALIERFNLHCVWDLGDTKLFDAAVLPAVLLAKGKNCYRMKTPSLYVDLPDHQSGH